MGDQFAQPCQELVNDLFLQAGMPREEGLLWIYLNLYAYARQKEGDGSLYTRQTFLSNLGPQTGLENWEDRFGVISDSFYHRLAETVLTRFSYLAGGTEACLELKELEVLYEASLQQQEKSKTGTYYTPRPIVYAMVINGISGVLYPGGPLENRQVCQLLQQKETALALPEAARLLERLQTVKIADIACGGGVFLREAMEILYRLECRLHQVLNRPFQGQQVLKRILEQQLYGADLRETALLLCRVLLLMKQDQLWEGPVTGGKSPNLYSGDVLKEHPIQRLALSLDLILGNPPYIGERGNRVLFQEIRKTPFGAAYYEGKMDYFYFFIYRAHELLAPGGILSYITTNYFVTADGAVKLREFMANRCTFLYLANLKELKIFKGASGQNNLIFILRKEKQGEVPVKLLCFEESRTSDEGLMAFLLEQGQERGQEKEEAAGQLLGQRQVFDHRGQILIQRKTGLDDLFDQLPKRHPTRLSDWLHVKQGLVSGADRLPREWAHRLASKPGTGIFVLTQEEIQALGLNQPKYRELLKPFYKNSHIRPYYTVKDQSLRILYLDDQFSLEADDCPELWQHLSPYRALLSQRREVKLGRRHWYALQWPRERDLFEAEKIVVPQRSKGNPFAYVKEPWYASADVYYLTRKPGAPSYLALTALLNSTMVLGWLAGRGKRKGNTLELYSTPLKSIPVPQELSLPVMEGALAGLTLEIQQCLQAGQSTEAWQREIDQLVAVLYGLGRQEQKQLHNFLNERSRIR